MIVILSFAFLISFSLFITFAFLYLRNIREFSKLDHLRNDFMAMMIHELRSPLAVIKGSANMLYTEGARLTSEQKTTMLKQIESSSADLLSIVNDLLDTAKLESGKIELFKSDVNLVFLLKVEVEKYKTMATKKGVTLSIQVPATDVQVLCDPDKIKHVMGNLLSNSLKFTEKGEIVVELRESHEYVEVSVSDTGIGIPDTLKDKLFNKFVQARQLPVSREKGTGLGLVIAKGMIEAHGGKIWAEDNYPTGTKMIYTLPKV